MPIIVNGITLPDNGDYIVVNGTKVNKVVANGVTVWEKETHQAHDAPPFLSAGWKTWGTDGNGWDDSGNVLTIGGNGGKDFGTQFIEENKINVYFIIGGNDWGGNYYDGYLFYSPLFSTASFSAFRFDWKDNFENMNYQRAVIRYSNDGANWGNWYITNNVNKSYKYAQAGYFIGSMNDDDVDKGSSFTITGAHFT